MRLTRRKFGFLCAGATVGGVGSVTASGIPVIASASDLSFAISDLVDSFHASTGLEVRYALGATGNLSRQIRAGAPFEMFMAADEQFVLDLSRDGLTRDPGVLYAQGRISIITPESSELHPDPSLQGLATALERGTLGRFAIANPEHAPYGQRAQEALAHAGLWEAIQPHLVLGENVAQAAQFAVSGNTDGGIIAHSLALAPDLAARGRSALIPAEWHAPLLQRMVLIRDAGPVAEAFYTYVQSSEARRILSDYGFSLPQGH